MNKLTLILLLFANLLSAQDREGLDRALFFVVSKYEDSRLINLPSVLEHTNKIEEVLNNKYGFKTEVIKDPNRNQIKTVLKEYQKAYAEGRFPKKGQLLIFFLGHGIKAHQNGYFLPRDADIDDVIDTGFPYDTWRPFISEIECQHILVAIDACHSVTFDPNWKTMGTGSRFHRPKGELTDDNLILENHKKYISRLFMTSDAKEDVVPESSNFTHKWVDGLAQFHGNFLTSRELFANWIRKTKPSPNGGEFEKDDPRSSFLFFNSVKWLTVNHTNMLKSQQEREAILKIRENPTFQNCQQYLDDFPQGRFSLEVFAELKKLEDEEEWKVTKSRPTKESYQLYLLKFPDGLHVEEAKSFLNSMDMSPKGNGPETPKIGSFEIQNFIHIMPSTFQIGSNLAEAEPLGASPAHEVQLNGYFLSKTEVSFAEFDLFCQSTYQEPPKDESWGSGNQPVINVSWMDAIDYCNWLSARHGLTPVYEKKAKEVNFNLDADGYRLPTEAEWEAAARSVSDGAPFANGKDTANPVDLNFDPRDYRRYRYAEKGIYRAKPIAVSSLQPHNGFYHLSGNVAEWCFDRHSSSYYNVSPFIGPTGPDIGGQRVVRGGSWASSPSDLRTWVRKSRKADYKSPRIGFRLARNAPN